MLPVELGSFVLDSYVHRELMTSIVSHTQDFLLRGISAPWNYTVSDQSATERDTHATLIEVLTTVSVYGQFKSFYVQLGKSLL